MNATPLQPTHLVLVLALALGAAACSADPPPDPGECPTTGRYFALSPGASWTYEVDDGSEVVEKTQIVGDLEDVGGAKAGTTAYRLTTSKVSGEVISWQEDTGTAVIRHREQDNAGSTTTDEIYTPFRTRVDESPAHIVLGAMWTESYTETVTSMGATTEADKVETWRVEAVDEPLAVPAGDFCTLRVRRTSTVGGTPGSDKTYWFARGIGKVKEVGGSQTEELLSSSSN